MKNEKKKEMRRAEQKIFSRNFSEEKKKEKGNFLFWEEKNKLHKIKFVIHSFLVLNNSTIS